MSQKKVLIRVVGPTAVGKSRSALEIARAILAARNFSSVTIISADSRQIYSGLAIMTGADIPQHWTRQTNNQFACPFFQSADEKMSLHGVSIITPDQDWSVAHFKHMAVQVIDHAFVHDALVILVGGTGLYHQSLDIHDDRLFIPPDQVVRQKAEHLSVDDLQLWLQKVDADKLDAMNQSDRNNPRRLIRAIEKAVAVADVTKDEAAQPASDFTTISLGLSASLPVLEKRIAERVSQRLKDGVVTEAKNILSAYPDITPECLSTLGLMQIQKFLNGEISLGECEQEWTLREYQYAKRQLTWWKKDNTTHWVSTERADYQTEAQEFILQTLGQ